MFKHKRITEAEGQQARCSGRRSASIEIDTILKAGFGPIAVPPHRGGAAERQAVGRRLI
jgi:hypothetical protein